MALTSLENKQTILETRQLAIAATQKDILSRLTVIEHTISSSRQFPSVPSYLQHPHNLYQPATPRLLSYPQHSQDPTHQPATPQHHSQDLIHLPATPNYPQHHSQDLTHPSATPNYPQLHSQEHQPATPRISNYPAQHELMIQQPIPPPTTTTPTPVLEPQATTPKPILITKILNALDSSEINRQKLKPAADIIAKFPKLKGESKAPTLAVKLAKLSFFGDEVLVKCTPGGGRNLPGLPITEMNQLKEVMFKRFSQYWWNTGEFETSVWVPCFNAIGQACKRLRNPR